MQDKLFVPSKIKVGFQERSDTYTGKLAYVIYYDNKGVLRKETSWESWRNKKIEPETLENKPTSGFVLNKKVGGYKSDWNMRQTYCRIFDPRGFEFEITVPNLLYILEQCDCSRGKGLEGDFVYSWDGKDLVLLPTSSPEFAVSKAHTEMQSLKISTKDLVPGLSYKSKKGDDYVYIGRCDFFLWKKKDSVSVRMSQKKHVFYSLKEERALPFDGASFLAIKNSDQQVADYGSIIDKINKDVRFSNIASTILTPVAFDDGIVNNYGYENLKRSNYFIQENSKEITQVQICRRYKYRYNERVKEHINFRLTIEKVATFDTETKTITFHNASYISPYSNNDYAVGDAFTPEKYQLFDLHLKLENGKTTKINSIYDLTNT